MLNKSFMKGTKKLSKLFGRIVKSNTQRILLKDLSLRFLWFWQIIMCLALLLLFAIVCFFIFTDIKSWLSLKQV